MANHKSAIKRAKQNEGKNLRNKANRTKIKNAVKKVLAAAEDKSHEAAQAALRVAMPAIQKAAQKGAMHRNAASRKISRLAKKVNNLAAAQ